MSETNYQFENTFIIIVLEAYSRQFLSILDQFWICAGL